MDIKSKMRPNFQRLEGGLFSEVTKADVGSAYTDLAKQGVALMGWADPFFPDPAIPPHVLKAATEALKSGFPAHYTMPIGNPDLKREIAKKLARENGMTVEAQRNIIITPGSDSGLLYAMMPFINPGDEVMVLDPSYPSNFLNAELLGGITVPVPIYEKNNFDIDVVEFKKRLTSKTKMVLLTNPNNPTTTVFKRESLEKLASFIVENDLICVVDQAFESTIFDGRELVNMATLPGMWERTLTVFSISKGMGLSGFRVGYIVAADEIMDVLYGGAVNVLGATNTMSQLAAIAAFEDSSFVQEYNRKHDDRRKYAFQLFNSIPGVSMLMPESGFLCWPNISKLGDSTEIMQYLIKEAKVACNDGKPYGKQGHGHLRIVIGCYWDDEVCYNALERIKQALTERADKLGIIR
ncbi:MAG: pyridoxal phosphate-dependent aminotransferase [Firmicutes bacterium]|nr:pyridoxal phosphate-dependent aminotransferase [Bacillota bacterium]